MPAPTACRRTGSGTLSLPCSGCFSPFPHGTGSLSVSCEYLALADGPAGFSQDSSCPDLLRCRIRRPLLRLRGFHPLRLHFPVHSASIFLQLTPVLQPPTCLHTLGLGSSPVARRYWGNHSYFLFLRVLRCFSSPRSPPLRDDMSSTCRVFPFGHSRVNGCLRLSATFRSLPRPSSPARA